MRVTQPSHPKPDDLLARSLSGSELPAPAASLELLAQAQQGDAAALEELVRRYQVRLRRIVRVQLSASLLRARYDSVDIVQSMLQAELPDLPGSEPRRPASLLRCLSLIATSEVQDDYRARSVEGRRVTRIEPSASIAGE